MPSKSKSLITTKVATKAAKRPVRKGDVGIRAEEKLLPAIHPGEILREEFMVPLEISINRLARDLHAPPNRISEIVNERRGISADTALRLARYFGNSPQFWINLQTAYDLELAGRNVGPSIEQYVHPLRAAGAA